MKSFLQKQIPPLLKSLEEDEPSQYTDDHKTKFLNFVKGCPEKQFWTFFSFYKDHFMINVNLKDYQINISGVFEGVKFGKSRHWFLHEKSDLPFFKMKTSQEDIYGLKRIVTCHKINISSLDGEIERCLLDKLHNFGIPVGENLDVTCMDTIRTKYNSDYDGHNDDDSNAGPSNQLTFREKKIMKLATLFLGLDREDQTKCLKECSKHKLIQMIDVRLNSEHRFENLAEQIVSLDWDKTQKVFGILTATSSETSSSEELGDDSNEEDGQPERSLNPEAYVSDHANGGEYCCRYSDNYLLILLRK